MSDGKSVIDIEMPDGAIFRISAYLVAFNRAAYYANVDVSNSSDKDSDLELPYDIPDWCDAFAKEFFISLRNIDDLRDWILNNMNWNKLQAEMVREPNNKPDYSKMLSDAKFKTKVIEDK